MAAITSYKQKYENKLARERREKREAEQMANQAIGAGLGTAVTGVSSFMLTKFPRLQAFDADGKVRTRWILGPIAFVGGLMAEGMAGSALQFTGASMVAIETDRWVSTWDKAQP